MTPKAFREELLKAMPGYTWTVRKTTSDTHLEATGIQSSGFNRLSTLVVTRTECDGGAQYEAKSAGSGTRSPFLHVCSDGTLLRALRGLQEHYQREAGIYQSAAWRLKEGRKATGAVPA